MWVNLVIKEVKWGQEEGPDPVHLVPPQKMLRQTCPGKTLWSYRKMTFTSQGGRPVLAWWCLWSWTLDTRIVRKQVSVEATWSAARARATSANAHTLCPASGNLEMVREAGVGPATPQLGLAELTLLMNVPHVSSILSSQDQPTFAGDQAMAFGAPLCNWTFYRVGVSLAAS
jgi:hypothetical protein